MGFDYKKLEIYSGLSNKEIAEEMRRRAKPIPKLIPRIKSGEKIRCVLCEQGYYVNKTTTFFCDVC